MNNQKKLELLSNALRAETKVLLATHFSCEEIAFAQLILIENAKQVTTNSFINIVMRMYNKTRFWQFIQKSSKLPWLLKRIRKENNVLLAQSLCEVKTGQTSFLDIESPLSLNAALLAIVNFEVWQFFITDKKEKPCNLLKLTK